MPSSTVERLANTGPVTAKQLQREFKITRRTLTKYTAIGLLPVPLTVSRGRERGVIAVWHGGVRQLLRRIVQLQHEGKSLQEIVSLSSVARNIPTTGEVVRWDVSLTEWPTNPSVELLRHRDVLSDHAAAPSLSFTQDGPPPPAYDVLRRTLWESIYGLTQNAALAGNAIKWLTGEAIEYAFYLYRSGYNTVFVYNPVNEPRLDLGGGDTTAGYVTSDFMLAHEMNPTVIAATALTQGNLEDTLPLPNFISTTPRLVVPFNQLLYTASLFTTHPLPRSADNSIASAMTAQLLSFSEDATFQFDYTVTPGKHWPSGPLAFSVPASTVRVTAVAVSKAIRSGVDSVVRDIGRAGKPPRKRKRAR